MNGNERRGIAAEVAIGVMVCASVWYFGVRPIERRLDDTRAQAEALVAQGVGVDVTDGVSAEDLRRAAARIADQARTLNQRGREAFNEATMFAALTDLARAHDLRLEQLQPSPGPAMPKPAEGTTPQTDASINYTMTIRGEFASIGRFLAHLTRQFPNCAVVSARVSAAFDPAEPPVTAVISTNHWAFDAMPAARLAEAALAVEAGDR